MTDRSPLINNWYRSVQFRNGPAATVYSFNAELNSGTLTEAQVEQAIISSPYTVAYVNPIIREYQIAFNRVPDQDGQRFWVNSFAQTNSNLLNISYNFANSSEFYAEYSVNANAPINTNTLTKFYEHMFCRAPDQAGLNYWLNSGLNTAQVMNSFVLSTEATQITLNSIPSYQFAEINGSEATAGSLFQYGGCPDGFTITMKPQVETIDVKEPSDKVIVDTVQQPVGSTWLTGSSVSGGGNTDINLRMNGNPNGGPVGSTVTVKNIVSLNVNLTDSGNLDASKFTNLSNINMNQGVSGKTLTVDAAQLDTNYSINLTQPVTMKFGSFSAATGSADTVKLSANNAGASLTSRATFNVVDGNTIEGVALNAQGNNFVDLITGSAVKSISLTGKGTSSLNVAAGPSGVAGNLALFDASNFNGDLSAKFDAGASSGLRRCQIS